jgi:hypothetical protein
MTQPPLAYREAARVPGRKNGKNVLRSLYTIRYIRFVIYVILVHDVFFCALFSVSSTCRVLGRDKGANSLRLVVIYSIRVARYSSRFALFESDRASDNGDHQYSVTLPTVCHL